MRSTVRADFIQLEVSEFSGIYFSSKKIIFGEYEMIISNLYPDPTGGVSPRL
jgi:hypothetical protein